MCPRYDRDRRLAGRAAPPDREVQLVDIFGKLLFERKRYRTREFRAAAGRKVRLCEQHCVAGASTTIFADAPTAAASCSGPAWRGPAGAPVSSTVSHSVSV